MSSKKVIVVFGATGAAGGSVAKYLLDDGTFAVRAVTRNADSPAAQALKARGAEVVVADLDKPETIPATLKGAYGVSAVTDFWALFPKIGDAVKTQNAEVVQGKALVDAAKAAGVQHFVFFTLPHCDCPHFEGKHQIDEYLKASGVPRTSFYNAFYFENIIGQMGMFKKADDGSFSVEIPHPEDSYIPSYSVDQSGGWVLAAFKNPTEYIGKDIIAVGENITPKKYAEVLGKALGKTVTAKSPSREEFYLMGHSPNPFVVELFLNMKYFHEHCQPPNTVYNEAASKKIYPGQHNFEEFVANNERFKKFAAESK